MSLNVGCPNVRNFLTPDNVIVAPASHCCHPHPSCQLTAAAATAAEDGATSSVNLSSYRGLAIGLSFFPTCAMSSNTLSNFTQ